MLRNKKGILSVAIIGALCFTGISSAFALDAGDSNAAESTSREAAAQGYVQENLPSQTEIKQYIEEHSWSISKTTFDTEPDKETYKVGTISSESLNNALNALNCIRYIAGLPEVGLKDTYTDLAQHAAFVNFLNDTLTHYPEKPDGCPDEIYEKGEEGARSSNIAYGYSSNSANAYSLSKSILSGWMNDSNTSNIAALGHRRWIINPTMSATGFGEAGDGTTVYTAMYSFDMGNSFTVNDFISWPAKTMPVEYFEQDMAWSVELGKDYSEAEASEVEVTLTKKGSDQVWTFNQASSNYAENYFNVNTVNYGSLANCIIFRPEITKVSYADGDVFEVSIKGLTDSDGNAATLNYTVTFFSLETLEDDVTTEEPSAPAEDTTKDSSSTEKPSAPAEDTTKDSSSTEEPSAPAEDTTKDSSSTEEPSTPAEDTTKDSSSTEEPSAPAEDTSTEDSSSTETVTTTNPSEQETTETVSTEETTENNTSEEMTTDELSEEATTASDDSDDTAETANSANAVVSTVDAVKIENSAVLNGLESVGLPDTTKLKVSVIAESDSVYQTVMDLLKNIEKIKDKGSVAAADLSLVNSDGIAIEQQLTGKIKITLELFENIKNAEWVEIFRYNETTKTLDSLGVSEVTDGKFTFETDHFTPYVFASVDNPSANNNNNNNSNNNSSDNSSNNSNAKTGDSAPVTAFVFLAATGLVGIVSTRKKRAE